MKCKFVNILTVCLITLAVLSPELLVFGVVWEQHMSLEQIQILAYKGNEISTGKLAFSPKQEEIVSDRDKTNNKFFDTTFVEQFLPYTKNYKFVKILQWFFLCIPIFLGILTLVYDRYLMYRAAIFQQQVQMLERLWQQKY
ncbi:MAG: hypothetical protein DSM106950_03550 [Stigonema ocellatum SAG 48.90 = DSM 106950]|nr:hypothetical protein [Stigonema ocellatum SAG 48.90 = DSM 106950]